MSATKRKLSDAFVSLDQAVEPAPPLKRQNTVRSLYSTLAKYGVKSKPSPNPRASSLSRSTPHLTAILNRAATKTRKALPKFLSSASAPPLHPTAEYRPSSLNSFLARLETFKLSTYANKPERINHVAAAKCGWVNEGKDRLVCGLCGVSWVVGGREGMSKDAANALVEKQRVSLVEQHKAGCPWRTRQCDPDVYQIPLKSPSAMVRDLKKSACALETVMDRVQVKHTLTPSQLTALRSTVEAFVDPSTTEDDKPDDDTPASEPSETTILAAFFGWAPAPVSSDRPRTLSASRTPSRTPSRTVSRANSPLPSSLPQNASFTFRVSTPSPLTRSSEPRTPPREYLRRISGGVTASLITNKRDNPLVHCKYCQRTVGLWAFLLPEEPTSPSPSDSERPRHALPPRQFDLLKEHRPTCPFIARSSTLPTLPNESTSSLASSSEIEGWRVILTVILRYGQGQRQRTRRRTVVGDRLETQMEVEDEEAVVDNVEAMVTAAKTRGPNGVLSYMKGILG